MPILRRLINSTQKLLSASKEENKSVKLVEVTMKYSKLARNQRIYKVHSQIESKLTIDVVSFWFALKLMVLPYRLPFLKLFCDIDK